MAPKRINRGLCSRRRQAGSGVGRCRRPLSILTMLGLASLLLALTGCGGQTTGASDVSDTDATLNATVNWNNGDGPGELWFEYSNDNGSTWTETPHQTFGTLGCGSNPCSTSVSADVTD